MKKAHNIDYSKHRDKRRKIAKCLYIGSGPHGSYKRDLDYNVKRNRLLLVIFALLILLIGVYSLFF